MKVNGIEVVINWPNWRVGSSFFIPCMWVERGLKDIEEEFKFKAFDYVPMVRVEEGVLGIRVWRVR